MKQISLMLFLFVIQMNGQKLLLDVLPIINSKVVYKNVFEVSGTSKLELQKRALDWFDERNISVRENKPLDDTHQIISGEHSFKTLWGPNDFPELYIEVKFKVNLTIKNERYQYEISDFIVKETNQATQLEIYKMDNKKLYKYNKEFYKRINAEINNLIARMEKAMI